jgi:hypothetical protein
MPGNAETLPLMLPLFSTVEAERWLACTRSTMFTVRLSPTRRARWSSNSGR